MAISPSPFERSRRSRNPRGGGLLWALAALLLIAGVLLMRHQAASFFWQLMAPVVRLRESLGMSQATALQAELASTTAALADRDALYKENLDLKTRLGRADAVQVRVLAGVLQEPPFTPYDTLLIDAGQAQGIAVGQRVAAAGNAFIGQVSEIYQHQARVTLYSAPGASYQALLRGTIPVAVEGQGGGSMQAEVPAGTQVAAGDEVVFPGVAGGLVAEVSATETQAGASFIVIYMRLPADPSMLRYVEVIKQ